MKNIYLWKSFKFVNLSLKCRMNHEKLGSKEIIGLIEKFQYLNEHLLQICINVKKYLYKLWEKIWIM